MAINQRGYMTIKHFIYLYCNLILKIYFVLIIYLLFINKTNIYDNKVYVLYIDNKPRNF